jgi:hypothetical protein
MHSNITLKFLNYIMTGHLSSKFAKQKFMMMGIVTISTEA